MSSPTSTREATTIAAMDTASANTPRSSFLARCAHYARVTYERVPLAVFYLPFFIIVMYSVPNRDGSLLPTTIGHLVAAYCLLALVTVTSLFEVRHVVKMKALETGAAARKLMYISFAFGGLFLVGSTATIFMVYIAKSWSHVPFLWMFASVEFLLASIAIGLSALIANIASNNIQTRSSEIADLRRSHE